MSRRYTTDYQPPAPVLEVFLALRGEAPALGPLLALVDTGADGTFVPGAWLEDMNAPDIDTVRVRGMFADALEAVIFKIDLIVEGTSARD